MSQNYLKRGKGKNIASITKYNFYTHYRKNSELVKLERKEYSSFLKELLTLYSEAIVKENMQLKLGNLGYIRIQTKELKFINDDGTLSTGLKVDWQQTWKHWHLKFPNKTRDERVSIKDKKVLFFENDHTNQEYYHHLWDKFTAKLKNKQFYIFKPSRQYSRLIKEVVTDPDRKVFYYK